MTGNSVYKSAKRQLASTQPHFQLKNMQFCMHALPNSRHYLPLRGGSEDSASAARTFIFQHSRPGGGGGVAAMKELRRFVVITVRHLVQIAVSIMLFSCFASVTGRPTRYICYMSTT